MNRHTLAWLIGGLLLSSEVGAADKLQYNRDVRPILAENCFACHGPDSASRKAGLRLDQREAAIEAGALVPGKPQESEMIRRLHASGKELMPPPTTKKSLTDAQKQILTRWIQEGAEYQPHWSFITPVRPPMPEVKNLAWVRNPIDRFILAKLEAVGLSPAPEADRRTLARRLSLDLTGLPPDPTEVEAFVRDTSPDWYEKYVDHLMKSPAWGEHRARYWLDAARYADTHGIHFDNYREMWSYRDWVINAFNRNLPFDQFTIEQLAGDLLPNRTLEQWIATGFNRCNITTNEGGAIDEEYLVLYARDRTETFAQVWLGLTANCAVCHHHKFDPLTMHDFYSLSAFFNNSTQRAMDGNIKDTPPIVFVPRWEDRDRYQQIGSERTALQQQREARKQTAKSEFEAWAARVKPESLAAAEPTEALLFQADLSEGVGKKLNYVWQGKPEVLDLTADADWTESRFGGKALKLSPGKKVVLPAVGDFDHGQAFSYGCWVKLPGNGISGAIFARMDEGNSFRGWDLWVQNNQVGAHIINTWPADAIKVVSKTPIKANEWTHVFVTYDGTGRPDGLKLYINGAVQQTNVEVSGLKSTIKTSVPFQFAQRHNSSRIDNLALHDVRIYGRVVSPAEVETLAKSNRTLAILKKPVDQRTDAEKAQLFDWWLNNLDKPYQDLSQRIASLDREEAAIKARGTVAHVWQEKPGEAMAYVLFRGEYDKRRDPVKPDTPKSLPPMPADLPKNRLGLAQWLLRPEHPLTARVTVNRFWQEIFGTGIVKTAGDFGVAGELPSHPELLDWLAVEFRESGWDIRKFFKLLVTSATYRQSAVVTPEKLAKDRDNRLLSRGPRFRLDAEMVRDYALAASGLLVRKIGGPSVKPYQPPGVWEAVAMIGSNTRNYQQDKGENLYRRSLYTFWKRSAPPASMEIFNAPNRETCTVRRERTNTPLQALVTLNDPQFVEAARHLATRAIRSSDQVAGRIDFMAQRLLARSFRDEERAVVEASLHDLLRHYQQHVDEAKKLITVGESKPDDQIDPAVLAAWTMVANELMNLDEVLNK